MGNTTPSNLEILRRLLTRAGHKVPVLLWKPFRLACRWIKDNFKGFWRILEIVTVILGLYAVVEVRRAFSPRLQSSGPLQRDATDATGIDLVFDNPSWFPVKDVEVSLVLVRIDDWEGNPIMENVAMNNRWRQPIVSGGHRMRVALANVLSSQVGASHPAILSTDRLILRNGEIELIVRYRTWFGWRSMIRSRYWLLTYGETSYDWETMDPALRSDFYWNRAKKRDR